MEELLFIWSTEGGVNIQENWKNNVDRASSRLGGPIDVTCGPHPKQLATAVPQIHATSKVGIKADYIYYYHYFFPIW